VQVNRMIGKIEEEKMQAVDKESFLFPVDDRR
jgi:hypothetical protein